MAPAYSHRSRSRRSSQAGSAESQSEPSIAVPALSSTTTTPLSTSGPAIPRRAHTKSRRGCRTCKRRKIKCDERRPSCGNCIKHDVGCDFLREASPAVAPVSPNGGFGETGSASRYDTTGGSGSLNMVDLELLHNFTTFTYATLSGDYGVRQFFRLTLIRRAFDCEYLMHCILAVSALHLARFRRDRTDYYAGVALIHHHLAAQVAVPLMGDIQLDNAENLHLFSVLTLYFAFGYPKTDQDSLLLGDSIIPNWLALLRGSEPSLGVLQPKIYKGPLTPLFAYGTRRWRVVYAESAQSHPPWLLAELQGLVHTTCTDPALLSVYDKTIDNLRGVLSNIITKGPSGEEVGDRSDGDIVMQASSAQTPSPQRQPLEAWDILVWKWDVARDFLPLLQDADPPQEAVAIFAHFLILIKKLENQWWLEGWATHVMEKVWASLDDNHRMWIQWPVEELGWVPP